MNPECRTISISRTKASYGIVRMPKAVTDLIPDDVVFEVHLVEEGILLRAVPRANHLPDDLPSWTRARA